MLYISLDLETTGLDYEAHQILEFGAILEDTKNCLSFDEIPKFSCIIERNDIVGQIIAIDMNQRIINILSEYWKAPAGEKRKAIKEKYNIIREEELAYKFKEWITPYVAKKILDEAGNIIAYKDNFFINIAGKNFASFDNRFLEKVPGWMELIKHRTRVIDPAILFTNWLTDESLPSLGKCLERTGIEKTVTHNAIEDAWDVVQVLRTEY